MLSKKPCGSKPWFSFADSHYCRNPSCTQVSYSLVEAQSNSTIKHGTHLPQDLRQFVKPILCPIRSLVSRFQLPGAISINFTLRFKHLRWPFAMMQTPSNPPARPLTSPWYPSKGTKSDAHTLAATIFTSTSSCGLKDTSISLIIVSSPI